MNLHPPLVAASLSGESDARWARERSRFVGMVCLGGVSMDASTRAASSRMVGRGRNEFLVSRPERFLDRQLRLLSDCPMLVALNVRSATLRGFLRAARIARAHGALVEINAHCRQPEMLDIGCGESLLADPDKLEDCVRAVKSLGVTVGVKGRFEIKTTDPVRNLNRAAEAGADFLHVDAMDSEPLIRNLRAPFIIANNGIREGRHVRQYADYGADAVSVARASEPEDLRRLLPEVEAVLGE